MNDGSAKPSASATAVSASPREERVGAGVPATRAEREALARRVADFARGAGLVPPLTFPELGRHVETFLRDTGTDRSLLPYAAVLLNNEVWKGPLAAVPYERRLLLLPQCLRVRASCRGRMDEFGLVCERCGACHIDALTAEARRLGYTVLVAEGTPIVVELIRSGQVQGIVGVSCLSSLERVFPLMEASAVPAVAIPLLRDGCEDTAVDAEWVLEALRRRSPGGDFVDRQAVQRQVEGWFTSAGLAAMLGEGAGSAERIARDWLLEAGKRWRPLLTACTYAALRPAEAEAVPAAVRRLALAVECFHKASLVHDDIEDGDAVRYGRQTLHERWGVPVALNVGDLLLGEGYRLIGECGLGGEVRGALLAEAARAHRELCLGQGEELAWLRECQGTGLGAARRPLAVAEALAIFRRKTAPAFAAALRFGAIAAGAGEDVLSALDAYSGHLGVAYQIHDDLADLAEPPPAAPDSAPRPSILMALAYEAARGDVRERLAELWLGGSVREGSAGELADLVRRLGADAAARDMLHRELEGAMSVLSGVRQVLLKRLLRQVLGSIFPDELLCDPGVFAKAPAEQRHNPAPQAP